MITVYVDVQGTLANKKGEPYSEAGKFLKTLKELDCKIVVWSGAGGHKAAQILKKIPEGRNIPTRDKGPFTDDMVFIVDDDMFFADVFTDRKDSDSFWIRRIDGDTLMDAIPEIENFIQEQS